MVICLERGADLHMAQLMRLPLTVSCFSKIQIGFTFLVPAHLGSPEKRAVKRVQLLYKLLYNKSKTSCIEAFDLNVLKVTDVNKSTSSSRRIHTIMRPIHKSAASHTTVKNNCTTNRSNGV